MIVTATLLLSALQVPTLSGVPALRIGGADAQGAAEFARVTAVTRQSNGSIVVADEGALEVRIFSAEGQHRATFGRRGEGPGEFQALTTLFTGAADSLWAWDGRLRRITVFTPQGRYARSFALQPALPGHQPRPLAMLGHSLLLGHMRSYSPKEGQQGIQRDSIRISLVDATGVLVRDLGGRPNEEVFVRSDGNAVTVSDLPFGNHAIVTGNGMVWVRGDTRDGRLERLDANGRILNTFATGFATPAITAQQLRAARARETARLPQNDVGRNMRDNIDRKYAALPTQLRLPAMRRAVVADDGRIWVQRHPTSPEDPTDWTVFDATGRPRGRLVLPAGSDITTAGSDWVLTRARDEFDVPVITLWRLR